MKRGSRSARIPHEMRDWTLQRTISTTSGVVAGTDLPSDPTSDAGQGRRNALAGAGGVVQIGIVVRSGVGIYDCGVRIGGREIGCQVAMNVMSPSYGYSFGFVPPEGTRVIVVLASRSAPRGFIVGILPLGWMVTPATTSPHRISMMYAKSKAGFSHYGAFETPPKDEKYSAKVASPNNRPADALHGEASLTNEHSCGFFGGTFSASIMGGGSFVRVSRIDEMIRMRSANYSRWSDHVSELEGNDWAYVSGERCEYSYQGERLGDKGLVATSPITAEKHPVVPHPRVKSFSGALAATRTEIVERPEQDRIENGAADRKPKDEAVLSSHVGEDGQTVVRTAGGIAIERYDRIPSVRRVRQPWDPEGDRNPKHEPIKPFRHDPGNVGVHPLELFDAIAWEQKGMYQRFDEHEKDFKTQEEQEIESPGDGNRDPAGSSSNMSANKRRRAGVYVGQDGSLVLRDAYGSELVFAGGNAYINVPGSIVLTANKSIVSLARESNVMKAKEIAAVESMKFTEIRGVKYTNIQGGSSNDPGGVLIESFGEDDVTTSPEGAGHTDGVKIRGVTLKAESGINFHGAKLRASIDERVSIGCGMNGERDGEVYISTGRVGIAAKDKIVAGTEKAAMFVQGDQFVVGADKDVVIGSKGGLALIKNTNRAIVAPDQKLKKSPVASIVENAGKSYTGLNPKDITKPYSWDEFASVIMSQLGRSAQYKSEKAIDLQKTGFVMYSPYWHTMKRDGNELLSDANPEKWDEREHKVYGNCAWPGVEAYSGKFAVLEKSVNLKDGYSRKRNELKDSSNVKMKPMSDFKV